ncbi:MAG: rod shape-determining protein RodA [Aestuariivita sp.]|nr:rod shape-determining protein RodA [Aestuariivita sp.]MCY4347018.1 rod shape-determining protein RodA [Aestuariivita sp.]
MSYLVQSVGTIPAGPSKLRYLNWPLILLIFATASFGFLMLYSIAGGNFWPWAAPQMIRFAAGLFVMLVAAIIPIWFWRSVSPLCYIFSLFLLLAVDLFGIVSQGAQRWLDFGLFRLQPSELMKLTLIMLLAAYYDWLPARRISHPIWVFVPVVIIILPTVIILGQPDLGTAILLLSAGASVMFVAGVHWGYFVAVFALIATLILAVFQSRGTAWQLLQDYQYRRIDTFFNPDSDPLGAGYHITQSKIALGSGGWSGRGFMQGTQSRLNFLPEKHTDFIFTTLAEEFGFVGTATLLGLYVMIVIVCIVVALSTKDRFSMLLTLGIAFTFFLIFALNMSMVTGLAPVVGVPLPLVSFGGSAMLVIMMAFGLVQSAQIHQPR